MSVNRYTPHVLILPEDDANKNLVNGFIQHVNLKTRAIQVLPEAGGWSRVLNAYQNEHITNSMKYQNCHFVMLIDFDNHFPDRFHLFQNAIPQEYLDRTYVIGSLDEPEQLKTALNRGYEFIGEALAQDCYEGTINLWNHAMLKHNLNELQRLNQNVKNILF